MEIALILIGLVQIIVIITILEINSKLGTLIRLISQGNEVAEKQTVKLDASLEELREQARGTVSKPAASPRPPEHTTLKYYNGR